MKRSDALKRHRASVRIIAALAAAILGLLYFVVPRLETIYADRGIRPPQATLFLIHVSHFVVHNIAIVTLLAVATIGLLWTSFGQFDRRGDRDSAAEG